MGVKNKIDIAVIGASGYTGLELVKILANHKNANLKFVTSRTYRGKKLGEVFPSIFEGPASELVFMDEILPEELEKVEVMFLCLPPLESMKFLKNYISKIKGIIIDLGADFRITNPEDFKKWYGEDHILPEFLPLFVYGLPEINRDKIRGSRYIANPGCYPTSILLGLAPILSERDFQVGHIVIDSKSGVTGAGRKLKPEYLFLSVNENFLAYSAVCHRHIGEIEQEIEKISGKKHKICFTPHLLPLSRGIFTSIYCHIRVREKEGQSLIDTKDTFDNQDKALFKEIECDKEFHINGEEVINIKGMIKGMLTKRLYSLYQNFYKDSLFVRFLGEKIPQIKDVVGTNMCHIGIAFDERTYTLKIFSAIDNLLKGASGQAVQNMNIAMGLDEMEGLAISGIFS